jgi:7-carboxy-7-deazaguanine synthase
MRRRLSGRFDWITLSPKRHRPPTSELLQACDELKVVVTAAADLAFGLRQGDGDGRSGAPGAKPRR